MKSRLIIFCISCLVLVISNVNGQNRVVRGKVIGSEGGNFKDNPDREFWKVAGANIVYNDSISIGTTNKHGEFELEISTNISEIKIRSIGMAWETIPITSQCEYLEVILIPDSNGSKRIKRKERKIIPELYRIAFKHGLIQTPVPCR